MAGCCDGECGLDARQEGQRRTLQIVLAINAVMFVVIVVASQIAGSTALFADSLDNLGDALTYVLSLMVVASGAAAKARVALFKGVLILVGALLVAAQVVHRLLVPEVPIFAMMGAFSVLALVANGICLALLTRHRGEDVNMDSVWECSRNDILTNSSVILAAAAVWFFGSGWPDLLIAMVLVVLLLRSAARVLGNANRELTLATQS